MDFHRDIFQKGHHAKPVDAPGKVVVETVEGTGMGKTLHDTGYLPVRERAAERHQCHFRIYPCPVHLVECHRIESGLTEEHAPDRLTVAARQVGHPCRGGGIGAGRLGLVAAVPPYLVAPDFIISCVRVGETDVVAVELAVPAVTYEADERRKFPDRLGGNAPEGEQSRCLLRIDRLHLIP